MHDVYETPDERRHVLADGTVIPTLGLGVWQVPNGAELESAVRWALELGYRHIDTAQAYGNEESVGKALRDSGVPRKDVFITTKFHPGGSDPAAEAEQSLRRLGIDQIDLYIIHWPQDGPTWAWPGMEQAKERGYARSIGVSNFSADELNQVIAVAKIPPVANQIQFSPFKHRRGLLDACQARDVAVVAYSSLGTGRNLEDPTVAEIAGRVGRTPAQVLLRWCIQRNTIVIPKSVHRQRIEENARLFDFSLSADDVALLDALDETDGTEEAQEQKWW